MHNYKYMHFITRIDFAISLSLVDDTTSNRPPASLKARPILSSRMIDTTAADRFFSLLLFLRRSMGIYLGRGIDVIIYLRCVNMQSNGFIELFNYLYLFGTSRTIIPTIINNTETRF